VLGHRIRESLGSVAIEAQDLTLTQFVDTTAALPFDRKQVKPLTRQGYDSMLPPSHCARARRVSDSETSCRFHIEQLLQKWSGGVSPRRQRNIVVLLQGIFRSLRKTI